nr:nucleotidyltransferase family protein [uncultured Cohaesibacter sp.]
MESPHLVKADAEESKLSEQERRFLLAQFVLEDESLMEILNGLRDIDLPDWRLVSGAIYQTVWNRLTGQPQGYGIKDYDVAYFDASDRSYEAEDGVIKRVEAARPKWQGRIEVRNQARVHLWYPERFGGPYPELKRTDESLENYMCTTHAVAVRLEADDSLSIAAPFGLEDIFSLTIRPCRRLPTNRTHYAEKARRMARHWPQLRILDWETEEPIRLDQL